MKARMALAMVALALAAIACGGTGGTEATSTPQESAWYACTTLISKQVGLSIMDAERYSGSKVASLGSSQYRASVLYPDTGTEYECTVLRHANGDWELLSLETK